ncbi:hypothetical protein [Helicobacter suis]|uniref:hypothetical protein n=1 Tax=Helicobacter suis TaxID=104628 RepID=UPI0013D41880|nr:hypothetical protein [Helicobacter suis]
MIDPSEPNVIEVEVLENIPTDYRALVEAAYALGLKKGRSQATTPHKPTNKPKQSPKLKPLYNANDFYKEFGTDKPFRD